MEIGKLESVLSRARSVCALTGAGVSAESGIPTFRGAEGLWRQFRAADLATPEAFARNPLLVWEWYAWRREIIQRAHPNLAHYALAELEASRTSSGLAFTLITQNVDGLHERAGSQNVIRLHGSIWELRCTACGAKRQDYSVPLDPFPPRCACMRRRSGEGVAEGPLMRPGVVWFGESLPEQAWSDAAAAASAADAMLVVGTSALVQPAASLPLLARQKGAFLVEINPERTPLSDVVDLVLTGKAGDVLGCLIGKRPVV
jgi:NAD-dependent deacetylase